MDGAPVQNGQAKWTGVTGFVRDALPVIGASIVAGRVYSAIGSFRPVAATLGASAAAAAACFGLCAATRPESGYADHRAALKDWAFQGAMGGVIAGLVTAGFEAVRRSQG